MAAAAAQRAGAAAPPSTSGAGDASQRATIDSPSALQHGSTRRVPSSSRTQDTKQRRASLPATPTRGVPLAEPRRHHLEDEPAHLGLGLAIPHNSTDDPDAQVVEPSSFPSLSSPLARTSFLPQAREHRDDLPSLSEVGEGEQPTQMAHQHRRRASVTSITSTSTTLGGAGGSSRRSRIPRRSFDSPTGSRRPLTIVPPPPSASVGCGSTTRSVSSERASPISGKAARGKRSLLDVRSLPSSPHIPPNSAMSIRLPSLHHSASLGLLASDQPAIAEGDSALSTSPPEHQPASPESIRPSRARVSSAPGSATLGRATTKKARVAVGPPASARGRMMPQMQERVRGASMPIPRYTGRTDHPVRPSLLAAPVSSGALPKYVSFRGVLGTDDAWLQHLERGGEDEEDDSGSQSDASMFSRAWRRMRRAQLLRLTRDSASASERGPLLPAQQQDDMQGKRLRALVAEPPRHEGLPKLSRQCLAAEVRCYARYMVPPLLFFVVIVLLVSLYFYGRARAVASPPQS